MATRTRRVEARIEADAIERAEQLLDVYARLGNGDAADLDAIALAFAAITP